MAIVVYAYTDEYGRAVTLHPVSKGVRVLANAAGAIIPDDEIPSLIGKLQAYMSFRAREVTKGAKDALKSGREVLADATDAEVDGFMEAIREGR